MIQNLFRSMFGCSHQRTTFPLTPARKAGAVRNDTYVACLDCGQEFTYDWVRMRVGQPVAISMPAPVAVPPMVSAAGLPVRQS
jgi:hypothetical protein